MVTVFVNKVYLYDDKLTVIFNSDNRPVEVDVILESEIERNAGIVEGSYMDKASPPKAKAPFGVLFVFGGGDSDPRGFSFRHS